MCSLPDYEEVNVPDTRFADLSEIVEKYSKVSLNDEKEANSSGIPIYCDIRNNCMITDGSDNNTIVVSSTGTGKTRRVLLPEVFSMAREGKASLIIHDPKKEFYKHTSGLFEKMGYKIIFLDLQEPMKGDRFNPLEYIAKLYRKGRVSEAIRLFESIGYEISQAVKSDEDPYWHTSAKSYFAGLAILTAQLYKPKEVTFNRIFDLHTRGIESMNNGMTYLKAFCKFGNVDYDAYCRLSEVLNAPQSTAGSIYSVFSQMMAPYSMNPDLRDLTSNSTFEVEDIIKNKTVVYLFTRDETKVYDGYIACVIDQFYQRLIDISRAHDDVLPRRVEFILDEFSNMSQIFEMQCKISISRSRNIRWTLCIQSLEQLSIVYGNELASVIINNCNNLLYLYSPDLDLLKMIETRCGYMEEIYENCMMSRPLISVVELQHLQTGQCLMLLNRNYPFIGYLPDISEYPMVGYSDIKKEKTRRRQRLSECDFQEYVKTVVGDYISRTVRKRGKKAV